MGPSRPAAPLARRAAPAAAFSVERGGAAGGVRIRVAVLIDDNVRMVQGELAGEDLERFLVDIERVRRGRGGR